MSFLETVEKARAFLERNGRVSLRALQREYNLDDGATGELIEELVEIHISRSRGFSKFVGRGHVAATAIGGQVGDKGSR